MRSAGVGDGYFPEPDEQKLANGIFVPDDLLARTERGFKIVGRISDVINIAGKKVNPGEVETHIMAFPGIKQAVVFGRPAAAGALRNEEVAACVVADADLRENNLLELCRKTLSPWQVPKRIFIVDAIPTNERGKISRRDFLAIVPGPGAGLVIGCYYGLAVQPNTQSLGEGTTASVVTSITVVILVDALFAIAFQNVGF